MSKLNENLNNNNNNTIQINYISTLQWTIVHNIYTIQSDISSVSKG